MEDTSNPCQINARFGDQCGQPCNEVQRLEEYMGGTISVRCFQLVANMAYTLFSRDFEKQYDNFKYRTALELSALRSGQLEELINLYEQYIETDKRFYGRLKRLQKMD